MKLTDNEKMVLREAQCDFVLGFWAARSCGLNRHRARRIAVEQVFGYAPARHASFLLAHHKLWATHVIRASIADED